MCFFFRKTIFIGQAYNFDKFAANQVNYFNEAYDYGKPRKTP